MLCFINRLTRLVTASGLRGSYKLLSEGKMNAPRKWVSGCSLLVCSLRFYSSCKVLGMMGIVLMLLDVLGVLTIVPLSGV